MYVCVYICIYVFYDALVSMGSAATEKKDDDVDIYIYVCVYVCMYVYTNVYIYSTMRLFQWDPLRPKRRMMM